MVINSFEEIDSWKLARELTKEIYSVCKEEKFSKDWGLKDQIQRASVSILANIAEDLTAGLIKVLLIFLIMLIAPLRKCRHYFM